MKFYGSKAQTRMGLRGLKSTCLQCWDPSRCSRRECISLLNDFLVATYIPWFMVPIPFSKPATLHLSDPSSIVHLPLTQRPVWNSDTCGSWLTRSLLGQCKSLNQKSEEEGTSLAIHWLRLHASKARGMGSILGRGIKMPQYHGAQERVFL